MRRLDVFVSADAGPLHLAGAAGVGVIGLFMMATPDPEMLAGAGGMASAYPLGAHDLALTVDKHTPQTVAAAVIEYLKLMGRV
jgi:ADP-heptose:LPS heptosyltransferase